MKSWLVIILVFLVAGCAPSIVRRDSTATTFTIEQHFSLESKNKIYALADLQCGKLSAAPRLIDNKRGCLLCKSEYSEYRFTCIPNSQITQESNKKVSSQKDEDSKQCAEWGFSRGTEKFSECLLQLYVVRKKTEMASAASNEISRLTEQQRRTLELSEVWGLLNLSNSINQSSRTGQPHPIAPFTCTQIGNDLSCR